MGKIENNANSRRNNLLLPKKNYLRLVDVNWNFHLIMNLEGEKIKYEFGIRNPITRPSDLVGTFFSTGYGAKMKKTKTTKTH